MHAVRHPQRRFEVHLGEGKVAGGRGEEPEVLIGRAHARRRRAQITMAVPA